MNGIKISDAFTVARCEALKAQVSAIINGYYDGGYGELLFPIHPSYESVILPLLTDEERAMIQPIDEILTELGLRGDLGGEDVGV